MALALCCAGCGNQAARDPPLPDLATQSPSKQPIMTPGEQKKAMDAIIAKREAQAAEAAARSGETKSK